MLAVGGSCGTHARRRVPGDASRSCLVLLGGCGQVWLPSCLCTAEQVTLRGVFCQDVP